MVESGAKFKNGEKEKMTRLYDLNYILIAPEIETKYKNFVKTIPKILTDAWEESPDELDILEVITLCKNEPENIPDEQFRLLETGEGFIFLKFHNNVELGMKIPSDSFKINS